MMIANILACRYHMNHASFNKVSDEAKVTSPVKRAIKIVPPNEQVSGGYTPTIIARNQIKINSR
jgi:hypothetical protein